MTPVQRRYAPIKGWPDNFGMSGRISLESVAEFIGMRTRLDKLEAALAAKKENIAESTKSDLRADLAALPQNNVIVSYHGAELARVNEDQFWSQIGIEGIGHLRSHIAPILRARSGADFKAMRFETDVVELGSALLAGKQEAFDAIRESIVEQASELPLTVNLVAREKELIEQVQQPHWWAAPTEEKLRSLIERLSPLMRFRRQRKNPIVKLDIADLVTTKEWIEFGTEHERMTTSTYRERLEAYVRELAAENPVLQKIQTGKKVSTAEIHKLASLFEDQALHVTEDVLRKVYDHKTARFIQFMRHILGLAKLESWTETVTAAFDAFIAEHNALTELQIRFLQTLKTFVLQTGKVERYHLIEAPFTSIHPQGIRGVFKADEIDEVIRLATQLAA